MGPAKVRLWGGKVSAVLKASYLSPAYVGGGKVFLSSTNWAFLRSGNLAPWVWLAVAGFPGVAQAHTVPLVSL